MAQDNARISGKGGIYVDEEHKIEVGGVQLTEINSSHIRILNMMLRQLAKDQITLSILKNEFFEETGLNLPYEELKVRYQAASEVGSKPWEEVAK